MAAALTPATQLRILLTNPRNLNLAFEQKVMDREQTGRHACMMQ